MKSLFSRVFLVLLALMLVAAALPAFAEDASATGSGSSSEAPASSTTDSTPWWEKCPPPRPKTKTRVVVRQAETLIESIPAEGWCYTAIKKVNVRSQPSIYATRVMTIRSAGTEFSVSARAKNSAGELWYAVKLANGTLGYIRSDLLNTDHVILLGDPYSYEADVNTRQAAASESASSVINIITPPDPTPEILYVPVDPAAKPTPTPILVYVTPAPQAAATPQIIYVTPEP